MAHLARKPLPPVKSSIFDITLTPERISPFLPASHSSAGLSHFGGPQSEPRRAPRPAPRPKSWEAFLSHRLALPMILIVGIVWIVCLGVLYQHKSATRVVVAIPPELRELHAQAEAGDVNAMRMLGIRYCYGVGTATNSREGVKWLTKAARLGNVPAQKELAAMGVRPE